jgi:hypothetical protein
VLAALLGLVLAYGFACGGRFVLDPQGGGGGSAGWPAGGGGTGSDAGDGLCTPDAGSLGGVDCYSGCALCVGDACGNELGECVAFCIANVELALHSPCLAQFQAWNACVTGTPAFCGCGTGIPQACEPLWEPWAKCVDDYCPGVNTGTCQPAVAPAACGLGLECEDGWWPCSNYVTDSPLVCVEGVCMAAPCGIGSDASASTSCCTSDADCTTAARPKCNTSYGSCVECISNADCAALPATPVCWVGPNTGNVSSYVCGCNVDTDCTADSYCDTTTVATGTCVPGGG